MNRIFILIECFFIGLLQAHASLLISDSDISSNTYTYGLSYADTANSSKFYADIYSYSNVAVTQDGTGSGERHFISAESGSQSASIEYQFDFTNTKYRPTGMTVTDGMYDGYSPSETSTITTAYSTDNVNWTTITSVTTVGKTVDQTAGSNLHPVTLSSPTTVYYRVTYTANTGSFIGYLNQWNRLSSTGGTPFAVTFSLSPITISAVTITPSNPSTLQTGVMAAYDAGNSSVTIPAGTYNLPSLSGGYHLYFYGMKNFTINASNVTLIFTDVTQRSMAFQNCSNITFNGNGSTTMQRGTMPTSQGTIQSISGQQINVLLDQGYPGYTNSADLVNSSNFNPLPVINDIDPVTLQPKPSVPDIYIGTQVVGGTTYPNIVSLPGHVIQFNCTTTLSSLPIAVGDHVGWRGTTRYDIDLRLCQNMTMENFTMKGGAGFILHEVGPGGNHYSNIVETYPDAPTGATQIPLLSSCADGFHSVACVVGPTLTNCSFEGLDDDGITLHGVYGLVTQPASGNVVTANCPYPWGTVPYCKIGDALQFYDASGNYAGQSTITAVATAPAGYTPPQPPPRTSRYFTNATPVYVQITLATAVSAQANWVFSNQNMMSNGFTITGCKVHNGRGNAMLLQAGNGTVQGCDFAYTANGLTVIPEINSWGQSDYVQNLTITNNTFTNIGVARAFFLGALTVGAYEYNPTTMANQYVAYPGGHQNVTISNNTFKNNNNINILISSAQNVQITDNNFVQPMTSNISLFNGTTDANQNALIWLTQCQGVSLSGNYVGSPGSYMTSPVIASATASGTGFTTGITVGKEVGAFFDGGNSSGIVDAYPGTNGNGWLSAWTAAANASTESATVNTATPLYSDTGSYLQATVNTTASTSATASVYRKFDTATIDVTQPHQIAFDFRPDTVDSNARYILFDRVGGGSFGTDSSDTWLILGYGSGWNFFNGNGAGSGTNVSSGMSLVAGKTYHFVLYITPSSKTWTATVTDGTTSYSSPTLGFRMNSTSDGQYMLFGASNNTTATASTYTFSIDSLVIANMFTPSLASDSYYRSKLKSFVKNMEKALLYKFGLEQPSKVDSQIYHAPAFGEEKKAEPKT